MSDCVEYKLRRALLRAEVTVHVVALWAVTNLFTVNWMLVCRPSGKVCASVSSLSLTEKLMAYFDTYLIHI